MCELHPILDKPLVKSTLETIMNIRIRLNYKLIIVNLLDVIVA